MYNPNTWERRQRQVELQLEAIQGYVNKTKQTTQNSNNKLTKRLSNLKQVLRAGEVVRL